MAVLLRRPLLKLLAVSLAFFSMTSGPAAAQEKSVGKRPTSTDSARRILETRCFSCHGRDGLRKGSFRSILDRDRLVSGGIVVPGKPLSSPLYRQIARNAMPKKGKPLTAKEKSVIRQWIAAGAHSFQSSSTRTTLSVDVMLKRMAADINRVPLRSRKFVRYFSLANLYNAGVPNNRLDVYRHGLTRLLNSLSWNHQIVPPLPIDREKTIYRIDVRDYLWSRVLWERIVEAYPYGVLYRTTVARRLSKETQTRLPFLRADWFLRNASRPPIYHELLELPETAGELERRLGVNVRRNLEQERRVARAGFDESGVSRNNRIIERHVISANRGYWRSYDFASSIGRAHIKSHPFGPGQKTNEFRHDGGEIIFHLPNGMQAYLLIDGQDRRIDVAPVSIVSDPKASPPAIVNGISCMRCHVNGMIIKSDEIRANADSFVGEARSKLLTLYPPKLKFDQLLNQDRQRFENAVKSTGAPLAQIDPIFLSTAEYEDTMTLKSAAAESGVSIERLKRAVARSAQLGPLARGQTIKREAFESSFGELVGILRTGRYLKPLRLNRPLGKSSSLATPRQVDLRFHGSKAVIPLPEPFAQVRTGGAGRFLIFHFKKARTLAVFDVTVAKFVHQIRLASNDIHFAAGREKLMIVLAGQRLLERWSLKSFEREKTVPLPGTAPVLKALMGCNSNGPLVLWSGSPVELWDVKTMKPLKTKGMRVGGRNQWTPTLNISADGRAVLWSHGGLSPSKYSLMRITDKKITTVVRGGRATSSRAFLNADASLIFAVGLRKGLLNGNWNEIPIDYLQHTALIPTEDRRFFLAVSPTGPKKSMNISFCVSSDGRRLHTMNVPENLATFQTPVRYGNFEGEPRVHYLPDANLFVTLPEGNDKVIVRKFDLLAALDKSPDSYLFVQSAPILITDRRKRYAYQLDVKSKSGGVTFKLTSGPRGMTISQDGRITWRVPANKAGKTSRVVVSVSDRTGRVIYHTFEIVVR